MKLKIIALLVISIAGLASCMKGESQFSPMDKLPAFAGISNGDFQYLTEIIDSVVEIEDSEVFVYSDLYVVFLCQEREMDVNGESVPFGVLTSISANDSKIFIASPDSLGSWNSATFTDKRLAVKVISDTIRKQKQSNK